jgi:hypothetical protein
MITSLRLVMIMATSVVFERIHRVPSGIQWDEIKKLGRKQYKYT